MNLTRTQILNGDFKYPEGFIALKPTNHFKERLAERGIGLECMPTQVRVTKDNIHSGKTNDNKHLHSVVIRLKYNKYTNLFMCINPYDGAGKSLWFEDKKGKRRH